MKIVALTHQGLNPKYDHNEDSLVIDNEAISKKDFDFAKSFLFKRTGTFAVCDGVGGNFGGEIASNALAATLANYVIKGKIITIDDVHSLAYYMNEAVSGTHYEYQNNEMMSTFVGLFISKKKLIFANIGDSPSFLYRNKKLKMMSSLDTYFNKLIAEGMKKEEAEKLDTAHYITAAFGMENLSIYSIHVLEEAPKRGDKYLLMSDGIYDYLKEDELSSLLAKYQNIQEFAKEVERLVLERGANDNYTLIVVEY